MSQLVISDESSIEEEWVEVEYVTYPGVSNAAVDVFEAWEDYNDGEATHDEVKSVIESMIGVLIGDDLFCSELDFNGYGMPPDVACNGLLVGAAVNALWRSLFGDDSEEEEAPYGRAFDTVYLTYHIIMIGPLNTNRQHTALEYADPITKIARTLSARPEGGKLVSRLDWPTDRPSLNRKVGTVIGTVPPAAYWAQLLAADGNYDDACLSYGIILPNYKTYNSNSYVAGIVDATDGTFVFPPDGDFFSIEQFYGGHWPISASYFSNDPPCTE